MWDAQRQHERGTPAPVLNPDNAAAATGEAFVYALLAVCAAATCVCVCIHTHTDTHTYTYTHTHTHIYMFIHMYINTIHIFHICINISIQICRDVGVCTYVLMCMHIYTYVWIHLHIHTYMWKHRYNKTHEHAKIHVILHLYECRCTYIHKKLSAWTLTVCVLKCNYACM